MIKKIFKLLGSSILAIILVVVLIAFSLVGVLIPQNSMVSAKDMHIWQQQHQAITSAAQPIGFFHVFSSWPFIINIALLAINTFICTVSHFIKEGRLSCFKGPAGITRAGFYLLHIAILILLAGGFITAASKMDGYILLTEGQGFSEKNGTYLRYQKGPLHPGTKKTFTTFLKEVTPSFQQQSIMTSLSAQLEFYQTHDLNKTATIEINKPFTYNAMTFTIDETGFSPRILIKKKNSNTVLVNSFLALQTFTADSKRQYSDYLPLNFLKYKTVLTLYPAYMQKDGNYTKISEEPKNPLLLIESRDENGDVISSTQTKLGDKTEFEDYTIEFSQLSRWASFRVTEDPGYSWVWVSLWLSLVALILRYVQELKTWLKASDI